MCVFFFKQKTAYEMRISDWSSDVCSSDLLLNHLSSSVVCGRPPRVPMPWSPLVEQARDRLRLADPLDRLAEQRGDRELPNVARQPHRLGRQIGSASCRERVCQYV